MAGVAGYVFLIKKSGTSTPLTGETCSNTVGNTWVIDDTNKNVFNRTTAVTFYDNAVVIPVGDIESIDYLFGKVTFTGVKVGPITVDGAYVPLTTIAGGKEASLTMTSSVLDNTAIGNVGYHTKKQGVLDVNISSTRFYDYDEDFSVVLGARTPLVIEITPDGTKSYRGWFVVEGNDISLDIDSLEEESLTFSLDGDEVIGSNFSIN